MLMIKYLLRSKKEYLFWVNLLFFIQAIVPYQLHNILHSQRDYPY